MYSKINIIVYFGKNYFTRVQSITDEYPDNLKNTSQEKEIIRNAVSKSISIFGDNLEFKIEKTERFY